MRRYDFLAVLVIILCMGACGTVMPPERDYEHQLFLKYLVAGDQSKTALDYKTAEGMYQEALADAKKAQNLMEVAKAQGSLAHLYMEQGRTAEASTIYADALQNCQLSHQGVDNSDRQLLIAELMTGAGSVYYSDGKFDQARALLSKAVQLCESQPTRPPDFQAVYVEALRRYAQTLFALGDFVQGESVYKKAIDGMNGAFVTALTQQEMAREYQAFLNSVHPGSPAVDISSSRNAKEIAQIDLADRQWWKIMHNANDLFMKDKIDAAEEQFQAALKLASQAGLQQRYALTLSSLTYIAIRRGHYAEAEKLTRDMIPIDKKAFGEDHAFTGLSYMLLGDCCWLQQHYKEAETGYKEALRIVLIRNRPGDAVYTEPALKYALALKKLGKLKEARQIEATIKSDNPLKSYPKQWR
ncbi:MAG: hypothetical protein C5B53_01540 [Candidatus Melainabacteria bacterium]|nr:MAG: hypothetical protein C5B53_01540 [Candidatus Melainabacteria bacterium]